MFDICNIFESLIKSHVILDFAVSILVFRSKQFNMQRPLPPSYTSAFLSIRRSFNSFLEAICTFQNQNPVLHISKSKSCARFIFYQRHVGAV